MINTILNSVSIATANDKIQFQMMYLITIDNTNKLSTAWWSTVHINSKYYDEQSLNVYLYAFFQMLYFTVFG